MEVELRSEATDAAVEMGAVTRIEKPAYASMGDFEIAVSTSKPLPQGSVLMATFRLPAGEPVSSIPRSALLKTAEGTFAYTVNGKFYVRTPVKVGAINEQTVEISDGLYSGDEVVATPVMSLWMAELQVLRGGKACTCGH
jgi:multidrug efflux pump subunit AcrA (membrane-fusion protein)